MIIGGSHDDVTALASGVNNAAAWPVGFGSWLLWRGRLRGSTAPLTCSERPRLAPDAPSSTGPPNEGLVVGRGVRSSRMNRGAFCCCPGYTRCRGARGPRVEKVPGCRFSRHRPSGPPLAAQRRPNSAVARVADWRAATTLFGRAAACFETGRTSRGRASRGVPGSDIVRGALRRWVVVPAQCRTRHVPRDAPFSVTKSVPRTDFHRCCWPTTADDDGAGRTSSGAAPNGRPFWLM
jgi:hypothetical protein